MSPLSEPDLLQEEEMPEDDSSPKMMIAIYNNGVPSLVFTTEQDIYDILHGIEDPMECYPPDAQDAAELEACEAFVETMAYLALLEEAEERARHDLSHMFQQRWEVRRQRGLVGRPKPAQHSIPMNPHLARCAVQHEDRSIVKALPHLHRIVPFAPARLTNQMKHTAMNLHSMRRPIQQPRKSN